MPEDQNQAIIVSQVEPDIALITMDQPGSAANILNDRLFKELDQTMAELMERQDLAGVILYSGKPKIFVAGADLKKIVATLDWPDSEIIKFCDQGRAVMARFSRCPFVSVAAIHGASVGGGLELPLWCDFRIASNDRRTVLGLPEVKLGLVPGWAGTARLPRISGFENAADLVATGRLVSAEQAKQMKFIDEVVQQEDLIKKSIELIRRQADSQEFVASRRAIMGPVEATKDIKDSVAKVGKLIVANKDVFPFAPAVVLEHMERTATLPIQEAWDSESLAMAQVYGSPASRGLLNHFFLVDRNKKQPGLVDLELTPEKISHIGIVGAGLMGKSIAQNCLKRKISVTILDAEDGLADAVAKELQTGSDCEIKAASDYADFEKVDLVIESVVETLDVKKIVLQKIEAAVDSNTIIATNTSAIPIGKLADVLKRPENFCGIHFCHPELMSLVEVVCGKDSSEQTVATAVGFVRGIGKMPVAINDGAGFVVNRLLAAMIDQSVRLFTMGVPIGKIDEAMRDFGFQGGPFEIIDVIGIDTCMYAGRTMWESSLRCVTLSPILPRLVKAGRLGRKSGAGFYDYPVPEGERVWNDGLLELIDGYRDAIPKPDDPFSQRRLKQLLDDPKEIADQILSAIVLEATNIMDEELVADSRDIDLCIIHGFSFPQHQGGVLFWADQVGLQAVKESLWKISEIDPGMKPNETIKKMADKKLKFYESK